MDDEEVLDSWEDAADTGEFEKRMEQREKDLRKQEEIDKKNSESNASQAAIAPAEELGKSDYVPQIKILKRQNGPAQLNNKQENKKPLKTLAEKEAEYAAARARILGDYCDIPVEEDSKKVILTNDSPPGGKNISTIGEEELRNDYKR
eukprot:Seg2928.4 transcript_id=Seg2928.4/GoldUCD/mRNA.D3Y31 product="SUZ domain-containing protein 1" protein_id=Seg2928.4/GoldUCD/D3Y31